MNEAETRAEHIDPALKAAGWGVVEGSKIHREYSITPGRIEGYGKRGKSLTADYVLVYGNRKLAVAEAKARWAGLSWKRSSAGKSSRPRRKPRGGGGLGENSREAGWSSEQILRG